MTTVAMTSCCIEHFPCFVQLVVVTVVCVLKRISNGHVDHVVLPGFIPEQFEICVWT